MELGISLTYSDIFGGPEPTLEELMKDISSDFSITLLSTISAETYLDQTLEKQFKIVGRLLHFQQQEIKDQITRKIAEAMARQPNVSIGIFSSHCSMEFIHYELINYRVSHAVEDSTHALNFFKAYLIISKNVHELNAETFAKNFSPSDPFQSKLWPLMLGQYLTAKTLNPVTEIPKSIALLNHFESLPGQKQFVEAFLQRHSKATSWNYVLDIVMLISNAWESNRANADSLYPFLINSSPEAHDLLSQFIIDPKEYRSKYSTKKSGFTGLKEKPLFKIREGKLAVLGWNLISGKVYEGLVFDFYQKSGIHQAAGFKDFLSYKTHISSEVVEKFLFRKLIQNTFPKNKGNVVIFDDSSNPGFPDAYVRHGKYIFLFEIKDALFPSETIDAPSETSIKAAIDQKYNNKSKGTGQILKQLLHLKENWFETSGIEKLKLKRRNLVIYPVVIYTDRNFGLPGFNRYLISEFDKKVNEANFLKTFSKIKPLTFISLSFLSDNVDILERPSTSLKSIIDLYHTHIERINKKLRKTISIKDSFAANETLEAVFEKKFAMQLDSKDRDYVQCVTDVFQLTKHLPNS